MLYIISRHDMRSCMMWSLPQTQLFWFACHAWTLNLLLEIQKHQSMSGMESWICPSVVFYRTRRFFGGLVFGSASVVHELSPTDSASNVVPLSVSQGHVFSVWLSMARWALWSSLSLSAFQTLCWSEVTPISITWVTLGNAMSHLHMCARSSLLAAPQETRSLMWAGMTTKGYMLVICIYIYQWPYIIYICCTMYCHI